MSPLRHQISHMLGSAPTRQSNLVSLVEALRFHKLLRNARNRASGRTFVPKSALFVFDVTDSICSSHSFMISRGDSVQKAKVVTLPTPEHCAVPRAATESHKDVVLTRNPKCSRIARKCGCSSAVEHIEEHSAIPLPVSTQLSLLDHDVNGHPSA